VQFLFYKNKKEITMKKVIFKIGIAIIFTLFYLSPIKSADCPDDIYPEDDPWTEECDTIEVDWGAGLDCLYGICYCWRYKNYAPAPYVEVFFRYAWYVSGDCAGGPSNGWDIIKYMIVKLLEQNPGNLYWPCLDCPSTLWDYHVYWASCFDNITDDPCGSGGYCQMKYNVCCDNGERIVTFVSSQHIGDDCPQGCSDKCSSP
jgi:hypothetical protein